VDVVLCEMMHVGQLREKQMEVIGGFRERYDAASGMGAMPRFLPEACLQAVQPVQQDFTFHGYTVAAPYFQDPFAVQPRTRSWRRRRPGSPSATTSGSPAGARPTSPSRPGAAAV
jgi:hypothetical protein